MHGLLLVEVPRETVHAIREGFPSAELEETRSDQAAIVLERAVEDLEAVVVGPACTSFVEIAECAASADPALAVVILCLPEMSARVATATRFAPSLGKDVRSFVLTGNEPLGSALSARSVVQSIFQAQAVANG